MHLEELIASYPSSHSVICYVENTCDYSLQNTQHHCIIKYLPIKKTQIFQTQMCRLDIFTIKGNQWCYLGKRDSSNNHCPSSTDLCVSLAGNYSNFLLQAERLLKSFLSKSCYTFCYKVGTLSPLIFLISSSPLYQNLWLKIQRITYLSILSLAWRSGWLF